MNKNEDENDNKGKKRHFDEDEDEDEDCEIDNNNNNNMNEEEEGRDPNLSLPPSTILKNENLRKVWENTYKNNKKDFDTLIHPSNCKNADVINAPFVIEANRYRNNDNNNNVEIQQATKLQSQNKKMSNDDDKFPFTKNDFQKGLCEIIKEYLLKKGTIQDGIHALKFMFVSKESYNTCISTECGLIWQNFQSQLLHKTERAKINIIPVNKLLHCSPTNLDQYICLLVQYKLRNNPKFRNDLQKRAY